MLVAAISVSSLQAKHVRASNAQVRYLHREPLPISEILARAGAILKDSLAGTESAAAAAQLLGRQEKGVTA